MRQIVREMQLELFQVEAVLSEFETKRKELKAKLAKLGAGAKVCTRCETEMDIDQFYRDKQKPDGRQSWCWACWSEYHKAAYRKRIA